MSVHSASSRRSIRLARFDYSLPAHYFFTLCVVGHKSIFGRVVDFEMQCNRAGDAVWSVWHELPLRFPANHLDAFIVMPNHVHGILFLSPPEISTGLRPAGRASPAPTKTITNTDRRGDPWVARRTPKRAGDFSVGARPTLGQIIGAFKSLSAAAVNRALNRTGSVWQRNYYEHIVRNAEDLDSTRLYISQNPAQWQNDRENPHAHNSLPDRFGPL